MRLLGFFAAILGGTGALLAIGGGHELDAAHVVLLLCAVTLHVIGWTQMLGVDLFAKTERTTAREGGWSRHRARRLAQPPLPVPQLVSPRPHADCRVHRAYRTQA